VSRPTTPTVDRTLVVRAPLERAFALFVERFGEIKPPEHNLLATPVVETVLEPRVGGEVYDRAADGSRCRWARVIAFEPPHRLLLAWDIGPTWQLETDPDRASEVEIRFTAAGSGSTRVELTHRHLDRHGPGWESVQDGVDDDAGWTLYLDRYAAVVSGVMA
jgi:uncharacterized protein YndB with AHSA1/START domain